jgi:hypothetical protein
MRNLFDESPKEESRNEPTPGKPRPSAPSDAGVAWAWALETWLREQGLELETACMDQTFRAGGHWYAVDWDRVAEEWQIYPLLDRDGRGGPPLVVAEENDP